MFENGGRGIGIKGKDNGLLVLLAVDDRQVWIEVGYGLEPYITDGFSGETSRQTMVPYFKQGDYGGGSAGRQPRRRARASPKGRQVARRRRRAAAARERDRDRASRSLAHRRVPVVLHHQPHERGGAGGARGAATGAAGRAAWGRLAAASAAVGGGFGGGSSGGFGGGFGGFGGGRSGGGGGGASW